SVSVCWTDRPVTLPPGRARLVTSPVPIGSLCRRGRAVIRDNDVNSATDELPRDLCDAFGASLRPTILDPNGTTLHPAEVVQSRHKSCRPGTPGRRVRAYKPNRRQLASLLRARRERLRRRAAEQRYELAPVHSITSCDDSGCLSEKEGIV